jgi:hypothetical protein
MRLFLSRHNIRNLCLCAFTFTLPSLESSPHFSYLSLDFFSNRELLLANGNDIVIKGNYLFSSTVNPEQETEMTLRVSVGASPFLPCEFPYRISEHECLPPLHCPALCVLHHSARHFLQILSSLQAQRFARGFIRSGFRYSILDASDSNVFVEVDHGNEAALYTSGPHGILLPTAAHCFLNAAYSNRHTFLALSQAIASQSWRFWRLDQNRWG